jgi:hypothetical protein
MLSVVTPGVVPRKEESRNHRKTYIRLDFLRRNCDTSLLSTSFQSKSESTCRSPRTKHQVS